MNAVYTSDESKRRFEILDRQVFVRFRSLLMEPTAFADAERHDDIEAVHKKLSERHTTPSDATRGATRHAERHATPRHGTADVKKLLKSLYRLVDQAIRPESPGDDQTSALNYALKCCRSRPHLHSEAEPIT